MVKISTEIDAPYDEKALSDNENSEVQRLGSFIIILLKWLRNQLSEMADAININSSANVTGVAAATYTLRGTDEILHVAFTLTGTVTITLPTEQATSTRLITIKDADGNCNGNNITITPASGTLEAGASPMTVNSMSLDLYLFEGNWSWTTVSGVTNQGTFKATNDFQL